MDLLAEIGKIMVVVLGFYLMLKFVDYNYRHVWGQFFNPGYEKYFLIGEILFGVITPMVLCFFEKVRNNKRLLFFSALLVVLGFVTNRLNVSITGMEANSGFVYVPSFMEVSITLFVVAGGFAVFALAIKYLNVFPEEKTKKN
jgi:Ni/Fe-hydrogenase subunit HybB-like protein